MAWTPPRAPLTPHRLAKLANALGVSTPLPASQSSSNPDLPWCSVTPSAPPTPSQSRYLLHVIPPAHLPHDVELTLPPSSASGYHTHFRRGTLVALQSTLQAQLVVIAREYALPSTIGIVLYLVAASQSRQNSPLPFSSPDTEVGPRLSEEIWRHIWSRVLCAERDAPTLHAELNGPSHSLRPLVTPTRTEQQRPLAYPITPSSTSTTSSVSDAQKSADASSSRSEPFTPGTSPSSDHAPSDIDLSGLSSSSIIPILAKVEFDIDRRKATWYEPWVRSRRIKRPESRSTQRSDSQSRALGSSSCSSDERRAPYDLKLVKRMQKPPFLRSHDDSDEAEQLDDEPYALLSESPDPGPCMIQGDPLGDVFGTDAETWAEIRADSDEIQRKNDIPNVVELALDATSLASLPEQIQVDDSGADEVDEVRDIIQQLSRPPLNVTIPDSLESKRRSTPSTAGTAGKRPMPPPLVLIPKSPTTDLVEGTSDAADYRNKEGSSLELEQEYQRSRSPGEEKRVGTVFEDFDLGLDLGDDDEEYDENDPNDRRRSQYLMKAKLDEIERTLAQFSPQQLKTANLDVDATMAHEHILSTSSQSRTSEIALAGLLPNVWPSVPYASVSEIVNDSPPRSADLPPSPPRLALNGVSTGAPKAFLANSVSSPVPTETQLRRRELEQIMYPTSIPSPSHPINMTSDSPIPLPPDPFSRHPSIYEVDAAPAQSYWDPTTHTFSHEPVSSRPSMSSIDDGSGALFSATPSSRFSADSSTTVDQVDKMAKPTAPLVSVRGFKKLWRRSKSSSNAAPQPPTPLATSFQFSSSPYPSTPTDQFMPLAVPRSANGKLHVDPPQSDPDLPYSLFPSRPSLSSSRPNSPAVHLNTPPLPPEKPGIRKSILKSWKSVAGTGTQQPANGSEPRKSSERSISNETIKPRRPAPPDSIIPPSPQLSDQYFPSSHVRTESNFLERQKSAARSKMGTDHHYSSGSQDRLSAIPPSRTSVVMQVPGSASSSQSQLSAPSRESGSRESFETTSMFEIVSPPKVHPNLTYPYMTLDHE